MFYSPSIGVYDFLLSDDYSQSEVIDIAGDMIEHCCVTEDEGFPPLLSRSVLEVVLSLPCINWRRRPKPEGPGGTLSVELVANRVVLEWMLKGEKLGRGNRKVVPSCVVHAIRAKYMSQNGSFVGFREADDAFAMIWSEQSSFVLQICYKLLSQELTTCLRESKPQRQPSHARAAEGQWKLDITINNIVNMHISLKQMHRFTSEDLC